MKIDDQFILDLKAAHSTYEQFLDKKKKQKNSIPELNVEKEAEEARKEQLVQTETDLAVLHAGIRFQLKLNIANGIACPK